MTNLKIKTFSLIIMCSFLVSVWSADIVSAQTTNPDCEFEIDCDFDDVPNYEDNCPETYNPGQQDVDDDGTGDGCDDDTIFGYIEGEFREGIDVEIATASCSMPTLIATLQTDEDGYYAIGDLDDSWYTIVPKDEIGI